MDKMGEKGGGVLVMELTKRESSGLNIKEEEWDVVVGYYLAAR
jgi:hypothetical protein